MSRKIIMPDLKQTDILDLDQSQLVSRLNDYGIKSYRAEQILKWIYFKQTDRFDLMTDLSKEIRNYLFFNFTINRLEKQTIKISTDGSKKYLFKLKDGRYIETVLIPEKNHYTICISSQVGCAQGCRFCLTAKNRFRRNLSRGEIIAQVRDVLHDVENNPSDSRRLSNIVFMGMGEPLANYDNLISAIKTLTDSDYGLKFSNRRITVSTAGLIPKIYSLGRDTKINLAISLNAADNKTRNILMPINRRYPLRKLLETCKEYPLKARRRITFEYILIKGVNDSDKDANRLVKLLRPVRAKINLIPFNEYKGSHFRRPEEPAVLQFQKILHQNNYTAVIRYSKGQDISAACGQLSPDSSHH